MTDSLDVGVAKPDPAIFHAALETLGAAPERTLLVGDSLGRDGEGARRVGLGFIWIAPANGARRGSGRRGAARSRGRGGAARASPHPE